MASSDTDDDVILIAVVLLSGVFVNECKKKLINVDNSIPNIAGQKPQQSPGNETE